MVFCLDRHPPFREFFAWPIFPPTTRVYVYICVCVYVSVASTIAPPFSGYSFCLKEERERERRMRSHDWRQDITVPPARPFVPLCRTDRSTGSADYVPAFYDRTPSRLVSTIIFAFLPALSLQQRQALVRQFKKQQVTLRHPSNWPTFFSLSLVFLA